MAVADLDAAAISVRRGKAYSLRLRSENINNEGGEENESNLELIPLAVLAALVGNGRC